LEITSSRAAAVLVPRLVLAQMQRGVALIQRRVLAQLPGPVQIRRQVLPQRQVQRQISVQQRGQQQVQQRGQRRVPPWLPAAGPGSVTGCADRPSHSPASYRC
jgi:hypothetical protein